MKIPHLPMDADVAVFSAFMVACLVTGYPKDFWSALPQGRLLLYAYGGIGLLSGSIWVAETAWKLWKVAHK